jgi:serine/threonine protein kinase
MTVEDALASGARIGSYEVIDRLGAGGMGEVYRARDTRLGRTVAIKVLRSGADPQLLQRLDREARAASALNHPNIVHIYDVGAAADVPGAHYVVMEHVEARRCGEAPARSAAPRRSPRPRRPARGRPGQGASRRDRPSRPQAREPDGHAGRSLKILDFGLAKLVVAPLGDLVDTRETLSRQGGTQAGMLVGTLEYMSPEQASGRPSTIGRSVLARPDPLRDGRRRAAFRRDTPAQVLAAVIEREPEPLSRLRGDVPPALEALVSRCLQKDPERRFKKTDELSVELAGPGGTLAIRLSRRKGAAGRDVARDLRRGDARADDARPARIGASRLSRADPAPRQGNTTRASWPSSSGRAS